MAYLNSEEELAGVLGHEIGHVTARHGVKQQTAQTASGLLGVLAVLATGNKGVAQTTNYIGSALVSGYGRKHELQADRLGAEYLARINYNPESMLKVIGVLKNQELFAKERARANGEQASAVGYHGVFSSHPENDQRLQEVIRAAEKYQTTAPKMIDPEPYLKINEGMAFGDAESQGIIRKNNFYHKDLNLHLAFPDGWKLVNQPDRLLGISADKKQMIQFVLGDSDASDPQKLLRKTFPQLRSGQSRGKNTYIGETQLDSPWGKKNGRVAAIRHQGKVYVLMGIGQQQAPNQRFIDTVESLGVLKSSERKLAKGKKLKLVRVKRGDTFERLAKKSNIDEFAVSRLRLLNGLYPNREPRIGQLIKIVK
jgi:predicted Zn-dependent protease